MGGTAATLNFDCVLGFMRPRARVGTFCYCGSSALALDLSDW
jgi:hypothetical protein